MREFSTLATVVVALLQFVGGRVLNDDNLQSILSKVGMGEPLTRQEKSVVESAEWEKYKLLRQRGYDEVSNTQESQALRAYRLRKWKRKGLLFGGTDRSMSDVLFPGISPRQYREDETVVANVDGVISTSAPMVQYYFHTAMPGCGAASNPTGRPHVASPNVGALLQGYDPKITPFRFPVKENRECTVVCQTDLDSQTVLKIQQLIRERYRVQLTLDQLPLLVREKEDNHVTRGYPMGQVWFIGDNQTVHYYLFNHFRFVITYLEDPDEFDGVRITGFDVRPPPFLPMLHDTVSTKNNACMNNQVKLELNRNGTMPVAYSYEVEWVRSDLTWEDRWDVYLLNIPPDKIRYFGLSNSLMVLLLLSCAISAKVTNVLRIKKETKASTIHTAADQQISPDDSDEDSGWKDIKENVFQPPQHAPMSLVTLVASGVLVACVTILTTLAIVLGFANPVLHGEVLTIALMLYPLCCVVAGNVSTRLLTAMTQPSWTMSTSLSFISAAVPGLFLISFLLLNTSLRHVGARTASISDVVIKGFFLWVFVSTTLVFWGGRPSAIKEKPVSSNATLPEGLLQAHPIPTEHPTATRLLKTALAGGLLVYSLVLIEVWILWRTLWLHHIFFSAGFTFVALIIVVVVCAQVSIIFTFLRLHVGDHRWWWPSFWNCASSGLFLFLHSIKYLVELLNLTGRLPVAVYLMFMLVVSVCFGLACGSIGFLASWVFVRTIYGEYACHPRLRRYLNLQTKT